MSVNCSLTDKGNNARISLTDKIANEISNKGKYIKKINSNTLQVLHNPSSAIQNASMAYMVAERLVNSFSKKYINSVFQSNNYIQIAPSNELIMNNLSNIEIKKELDDNLIEEYEIEDNQEYFYKGEIYNTKEEFLEAIGKTERYGIMFDELKRNPDLNSIKLKKKLDEIKDSFNIKGILSEFGYIQGMNEDEYLNSVSPEISELLKRVRSLNSSLEIELNTKGDSFFDPNVNKLSIDFAQIKALAIYSELPLKVVLESVLGHELSHATNAYGFGLNSVEDKFKLLFEEVKKAHESSPFIDTLRRGFVLDNGLPYAFLNLQEFLSEAKYNPYFKKWMLKTIDKANKSLWDKFLDILKSILGIDIIPYESIYKRIIDIESDEDYIASVIKDTNDEDDNMTVRDILGILPFSQIDDRSDDKGYFSSISNSVYYIEFEKQFIEQYDNLIETLQKSKKLNREKNDKGYSVLTTQGKSLNEILKTLTDVNENDHIKNSLLAITKLSRELIDLQNKSEEEYEYLSDPLEKSKYLMSLISRLKVYDPYIESLNKMFALFNKKRNDSLAELKDELTKDDFILLRNRFNNLGSLLSTASTAASAIKKFFEDKVVGDLENNEVLTYLEQNTDFSAAIAKKDEWEKEIKKYEDLIKTETSTKKILIYQNTIKKLKKEIENIPTSKQFLIDELLGNKKDLTVTAQMVQSSISSSSKTVQVADGIYNSIYNDINQYAVNQFNKFQGFMNKFLKNVSLYSIKDVYKNILTKERIYFSNKANGTSDYDERLSLIDIYTPEYMNIYQKYKKDLEYLSNKKKFEKDETERKKHSDKYEELKKEYINWLKKNVTSEYTEEYNELNTIYQEDLGDGISLKSFTDNIKVRIAAKKTELEIEDNKDNKQFILDEISRLTIELKTRTSYYGKDENSIEYKIAKQYEKYITLRKTIYKSVEEMGENAYDTELYKLNRAKAEQAFFKESPEVIAEKMAEWHETNSSKVPNKDFERKLKLLNEQIKKWEEEYYKLMGGVKFSSEIYEEYKALSKKYREEGTGVIQGQFVTEEDVANIKRLQELEIEIKSGFESTNSTLTKKENKRYYELRDELKEFNTLSEDNQNEFELLSKKKNKLLIKSDEERQAIEVLRFKINDGYEILKSYYTNSYTKFYTLEFEKRKNELAVEILKNLKSKKEGFEFTVGANTFIKIGDDYYNSSTGSLIADDEFFIYGLNLAGNEIFKTEWYKNNHITIEKFNRDKGYNETISEPLYIWKKREFANPKNYDIIPSFLYIRNEVKEEFINNDYKEIKPGYAYPKKGKYENIDYIKLRDLNNNDFKLLETLKVQYDETQSRVSDDSKKFGNILPSLRFTGKERFVQNTSNISNLKQNAKEFIDTNFKSNEQDIDTEGFMLTESRSDQVVPLSHTGRISFEEQSHNVLNSLLEFDLAVNKKTELDKITPLMENLVQIAKSTEKIKYKEKKTIDENGNLIINKEAIGTGKNTNLYDALRNLVDRRSYGKTSEDISWGSLDGNKIVSKLMKATSFSTFTLQVFGPLKNWISAKLQNLIRSNSKKAIKAGIPPYIIAKAEAEFALQLPNLISDIPKLGDKSVLGQMIDLFQGLQGEITDTLGRKTEWHKVLLAADSLTVMKHSIEYQLQVHNFIMFALKEQVKNDKGENVSLYESFEKNIKTGGIKLKDGYIFDKNQRDKFTLKIRDYNLNTNGAYGLDKNNAQNHIWGKLLFNMMGYFVPGARDRYTKNGWNFNTDEYEKGWYGNGYQFLKALVKYNTDINTYWGTLSEKEKAEIGSFLKETITSLILMLLASSMFLGPDDDEKIKDMESSRLLALATLMAVKSELETFHPLFGTNEIIRKIKNPFTVSKTLDQTRLAVTNILYAMTGNEKGFYKRDEFIWEKGDAKFLNNIFKLVSVSPGNIIPLIFSNSAPEELYKQVKAYQ